MAQLLPVGSELERERLVDQHALDAKIEPQPDVHLAQAADIAAGELAQRRRIFFDRQIVEAARGGDAVLGVDEFPSQVTESVEALSSG
jgi:hypothetical protein